MRMKRCVCKTFPFVFSKKSTIFQFYVVNFISGTSTVQSMPFFFGRLTFSKQIKITTLIIYIYGDYVSNLLKRCGTYCPLDVCSRSVTNVEAPGHVQLFASRAYLSSSSHTTCSANLTWILFSGLNI